MAEEENLSKSTLLNETHKIEKLDVDIPERTIYPAAVLSEAGNVEDPDNKRPESKLVDARSKSDSRFENAVSAAAQQQARGGLEKARTAKPRIGSRRKPKSAKAGRVIAAPPQSVKSKVAKGNCMASSPSRPKPDLPTLVADVQDKALAAYEKSTDMAAKFGELAKGSAEAVVISGKTLGSGLKDIGTESVEDGRKALVTFGDDLKEFAAVKSPGELLRLQGRLAGRNLEAAVALTAKNGQALQELVTKALAPLSSRAKANVEAVRKSA